MRVTTGSDLRPIRPSHLSPNPLIYLLSLIKNTVASLTSNGPQRSYLDSTSSRSNGYEIILASSHHLATVKAADLLVHSYSRAMNPLLSSLSLSPTSLSLGTALGALSSTALLNSIMDKSYFRPNLAPLINLLDTIFQAELLRMFITHPVRLASMEEETKTWLCQSASAVVNIIQASLISRTASGLAFILELPQAWAALQHYRDIPLPEVIYRYTEWVIGTIDGGGSLPFFNSYSPLATVSMLAAYIMWTISRKPSPYSLPAGTNEMGYIAIKLLEISRYITHSSPRLGKATDIPLRISSQFEKHASSIQFQPRRYYGSRHSDNPSTASAASTELIPYYVVNRPVITSGSTVQGQVNSPLLPVILSSQAAHFAQRKSVNPSPAIIAFALISTTGAISYVGYQAVSALYTYLVHEANSENKTNLPVKISSHQRREALNRLARTRSLHISNFTPREQIDELILAAAINILPIPINNTRSNGVEIIARLADEIINARGDFNFRKINELFTQIKDLGGNKTIGLLRSKKSSQGKLRLMIWPHNQSIDLTCDIKSKKFTRPELRDALALIMHLILRSTETRYSILDALSRIKTSAVGLYYQWYIHNRHSPKNDTVESNYKNQTMQQFYDHLQDIMGSLLAPFNPQNVDTRRLIFFLIYLEMPNVCIGIQFDGKNSPAISKQNSYAIHGDLYLKTKGDELSYDNFLQTLNEVRNEDLKIINLITHSETYAAAFKQQGFIAQIHRMVFNTEYEIAEIEQRIGALTYIDRMSMIALAVSELGFNEKVPWTAKKIIPYPGNLSKENAFKVIHNDFEKRESNSGRTGAMIPRSHMIAVEKYRTWLEQYVALNGHLEVMLKIDPNVFDILAKKYPLQDIDQYLKKIISHRSIKKIFNVKYDDNLTQESKLIYQSILLSLKLLSQNDQDFISNSTKFQIINLTKYAHTLLNLFAQLEGRQKEKFETWNLASMVIAESNNSRRVYSFNRRFHLKTHENVLIERLTQCSDDTGVLYIHDFLRQYMTENKASYIETNTEIKCIIHQASILYYTYELDIEEFDSKDKVFRRLQQHQLQPRVDRKVNAYGETSEEIELSTDPRWLAFRPWLPFIECYDFSSGLANDKDSLWITAIDGLTCGLNFIPAGKIVSFPFRIAIKGVRKLVYPTEKAFRNTFFQSVESFFSKRISGISPETLDEFKRLYKNIYSQEMFNLPQQKVSHVFIDGVYNFISRGSPIPLPNFFKWNMHGFVDAFSNMNKGLLLKTVAQGVKANAAPAVGFIGQKIAPKVFRSVRKKLQSSSAESGEQQHQNIISEFSNPDSYLPYAITFLENKCTFNELRFHCDLTTLDQLIPIWNENDTTVEQLAIKRKIYTKLLIALFSNNNTQLWQQSLKNISVTMEINKINETRLVSFFSVKPSVMQQIQYLHNYYVRLWQHDFDALLQMITNKRITVAAPELWDFLLNRIEGKHDTSLSNQLTQLFDNPNTLHLQLYFHELVQNIQWTCSLPDMEDDRVSARYISEAFSQLTFINYQDWDKEFSVNLLTDTLIEQRLFLASITAEKLRPFVMTLVADLKKAFDFTNAECVYLPFLKKSTGPEYRDYSPQQRAEMFNACRVHQQDLTHRLPAIFVLSKYADFTDAREGRPNAVPTTIWSQITADEVFLSARRDVNRLFYRQYDRFIVSYDYQKALKDSMINETVPDRPPLRG